MIVIPIEPYASDPIRLKALCAWREARGEPYAAKLGVCRVIDNRCAMAPAQGFKRDITGNILHPWAFSSFNEGDPNSVKYPAEDDQTWIDSLTAANSTEPDNTGSSVFYFGPPLTEPPHAWGPVEYAVTLGVLQFYRIAS